MITCQRKFPHKRDVLGFTVNKSAVDVFSALHFATGYGAAQMFDPRVVFLIGFAWDWLVERRLKCDHPEWFPHPSQDTYGHMISDLAFFTAGAAAGYKAKNA
jgi:hypothetical protein